MQIESITLNTVKTKIMLDGEIHSCTIILDKDNKIETIGIDGDIMLDKSDIDNQEINKYEQIILDFLDNQRKIVCLCQIIPSHNLSLVDGFIHFIHEKDWTAESKEWKRLVIDSDEMISKINEKFKTQFNRMHFNG